MREIIYKLTKILLVLFFIATIISIIIVFKDIKNDFTIKFIFGYLIMMAFLLFYIPVVIILKLRKLKCPDIKKRVYKFICLVFTYSALNYVVHYLLKDSNINIFNIISVPIGVAFGCSFFDLLFRRKKSL